MAIDATDPHVALRVQPQQRRARRAVEHILDATGVVLDQVGPDLLTTKAVAAAAGVNIATLYRYFPDRTALLAELVRRYEDDYRVHLRALFDELADASDWRTALRRAIPDMMALRSAQPGMEGLRRSVSTVPELRELQMHLDSSLIDAIADVLERRKPQLEHRRAVELAIAVQATVNAVLSRRFDRLTPSTAADEAANLVIAYLAPTLG
jgi:AcrR family transcriptional regulator